MPWQPLRLPRNGWNHWRRSAGLFRCARWVAVRRISSNALDGASIAAILTTPPQPDAPTITAVGSVRTIRNQKQRSFVELGDGSTVQSLQALLKPTQAEGLGTGTVVAIKGVWRQAPAGKEQVYELEAEEVQIIGPSHPEDYPLQKKFHSPEFLRSIPHLRLRTPFNALVARLKSECDFRVAEQLRAQGFVRVQPPIITSSDCEGAGEVFSVSARSQNQLTNERAQDIPHRGGHFFRDPRFLTVSSQLHLEAFVHEHLKVWTLSPTFRAEKSDTPRHASEFWMLEAELRTEKLQTVIDVVENMIRNLVVRLLDSTTFMQELAEIAPKADLHNSGDHRRQNNNQLRERWNELIRQPYPRITYSDAIRLLERASHTQETTFQHEPHWHHGLHLEHEKYIAARVGQGCPVFVTDYPAKIKPFYMLPSTITAHQNPAQKPGTVACFDLLLPDGTEVAGGSLREHRLQYLKHAMRTRRPSSHSPTTTTTTNNSFPPATDMSNNGADNLNWYLDLRRYGSIPHGGFGLGFDRLIGYLAGIGNIKDVLAWPRYYGRCDG